MTIISLLCETSLSHEGVFLNAHIVINVPAGEETKNIMVCDGSLSMIPLFWNKISVAPDGWIERFTLEVIQANTSIQFVHKKKLNFSLLLFLMWA